MKDQTILFLTNSIDPTTDTLVALCREKHITSFRLNTDLINQYKILVRSGVFLLEDPTGRTLESADVDACIYRKPWIAGDNPSNSFPKAEQIWVLAQYKKLVQEIFNLSCLQNKVRLVNPYVHRKLDKIVQMTIARRYFNVPEWWYTLNYRISAQGSFITKALEPEFIGAEATSFLFSSVIDPTLLAVNYPWLIQRLAQGTRDATILFINNRVFGFRVSRLRSEGPIDWRQNINTAKEDNWSQYDVPSNIGEACRAFMSDLRLKFGRFDFIVDDVGNHEFLELNINGEFGWLDDPKSNWLHRVFLEELLKEENTVQLFS